MLGGLSPDAFVRIFDTERWQELQRLQYPAVTGGVTETTAPSTVALSADGERVATAEWDGRLIVWDVSAGTQQQSWEAHSPVRPNAGIPVPAVLHVEWAPDGKQLATAGADGRVKLWNAATGELVREWGLAEVDRGLSPTALRMVFHPSEPRLIAITARMLLVWKLEDGSLERQMESTSGKYRSLALSSDGRWLATGSNDGRVVLWLWSKQQIRYTFSLAPLDRIVIPYVLTRQESDVRTPLALRSRSLLQLRSRYRDHLEIYAFPRAYPLAPCLLGPSIGR